MKRPNAITEGARVALVAPAGPLAEGAVDRAVARVTEAGWVPVVGEHARGRRGFLSGSDAERARVNVTRAIRTALKRIAEHDAVLGRQLGAAIKTGTFCVYEPAPGQEPAWDLEGPK
ncbi:MAG: hypothetical protein KY463_12890 [Actinobacteria bacterium]|nr:hypothetical protein [Actinomycetota bacterium]